MRFPGGAVSPAMNPCHRLGHVGTNVIGGFLFGRPADLPDHQHPFGGRVGLEQFQCVDEAGAVDRISPDAQSGGLTQPQVGELIDRLIGQGARAADHPHPPSSVDVAGHYPDLALPRGDHPRAVGPYQAAGVRLEIPLGLHHVIDRDALRYAHDQLHPGLSRFHDGIGRRGRRNENQAGVGAGGVHRFRHTREDRQVDGEGVLPSPNS